MSDEKVKPFSNGTEYLDWTFGNCERCAKSVLVTDPSGTELPTCEIEYAIMEASISDGEISAEIAERMGQTANPMAYTWPCGEFEEAGE